jgi:glycosyltransferase involved in cell wall biosynthesis
MTEQDLVFVSWSEDCSRSDSIAQRLGGKSFMVYSSFWGSRYSTVLFKYLSQSLKTLQLLFRHRPKIVFVMTPPVIACLPVWLYSKISGAKYCIDAHSGAFLDTRWTRLLFIHRFFSRQAAATLVTSEFLAGIVNQWKTRAVIVPDVPVCFAPPSSMKLKGKCNMVFVSTFTRDEPLEEFLRAAASIPDVQFYVTGRLKDADPAQLKQAPANVLFTDFLSKSDYTGLLLASDAVMCLTTEDHTMQRGAYEAVYLGKPVITSAFEILHTAFPKGTVHVGSTSKEIAQGIRRMKEGFSQYSSEVQELRSEKVARWRRVESQLTTLLGWGKLKSQDVPVPQSDLAVRELTQ